MFQFNKLHLDSETTAEKLRNARQERGYKLEEVSKKLNISLKYLKALEKAEYEKLPVGAYGKSFLREYCLLLKLDYKELLSGFEQELALGKKEEKSVFTQQIVKKRYFWSFPKFIRILLIALVVGTCLFYLNYYFKKINTPPLLEIMSPSENLITDEHAIKIIGKTEKETRVRINGEIILADNDGIFSKEINLKSGVNIVNITAEKKMGKTSVITRQILVKEKIQF